MANNNSTLNFNVGVLGHVDSGKTSLAKALSTVASTACFDKNPQSKERGITIDLGFSSFCVDFPPDLQNKSSITYDTLQFTLVDCPGHASLIRTIIGGAQIIDLMMLVIDITKGMQTQTAECLVIGEITCDKMLIVLNKIDLVPESKQKVTIEKMSKKIVKTLENTKFSNAIIISVAAKPGGIEEVVQPQGVMDLINTLCTHAYIPERSTDGPFVFSADHCFSIRGQGTVMTGTVIQGCIAINSTIEIPTLKVTKKVKSMQMFRKPVERAKQGDRVGICVTQFDPKLLERGVICTPGHIVPAFGLIAKVVKINYYKGSCATKSKFHISMFHDTTLARCSFFSGGTALNASVESIDFSREYKYCDELENNANENVFALLEFEHAVSTNKNSIIIGSRLDTDIHANVCRLAFHGKVLEVLTDKDYAISVLPKLKVFKTKTREGLVERMVNEQEVIAKNFFKKETNIQNFAGLKVDLSTGESGVIEGGFGQSGKVKVRIPGCLSTATMANLASRKKGKGKDEVVSNETEQIKITLNFKRYIYDPQKSMIQN